MAETTRRQAQRCEGRMSGSLAQVRRAQRRLSSEVLVRQCRPVPCEPKWGKERGVHSWRRKQGEAFEEYGLRPNSIHRRGLGV